MVRTDAPWECGEPLRPDDLGPVPTLWTAHGRRKQFAPQLDVNRLCYSERFFAL